MTGGLYDRRNGNAFYRIPDDAGEIIAMTPATPNDHLLLVDCTNAVLVVDTRDSPPSVKLRYLDSSKWELPGGP